MNELINVNQQIAEVERRQAKLQTQSGRLEANQRMLSIIATYLTFGYILPDVEKTAVAKAWTTMYEEEIALFGFEPIEKASINFIKQDTREFKKMPTLAELKPFIREAGGQDPRILKARLEQQQREEEAIAKWKEENEKFWKEKEKK